MIAPPGRVGPKTHDAPGAGRAQALLIAAARSNAAESAERSPALPSVAPPGADPMMDLAASRCDVRAGEAALLPHGAAEDRAVERVPDRDDYPLVSPPGLDSIPAAVLSC